MDLNNTSDFIGSGWGIYISVITIVSILACAVLLWVQSSAKINPGKTTGHEWDEDLAEYNNPLPSWWRWMFYLTIAFALAYLWLYPGLGTNKGAWTWSARDQFDQESAAADAQFNTMYGDLLKQDIVALSNNQTAHEAGQHLFLTYCIQCHGSDAKGGPSFPNLKDKDWLWGGTPDKIKESITLGRIAVMPAKGVKPDMDEEQTRNVAHYVRSISGLAADSIYAQRGKSLFMAACAACHGPDGKGNIGLAPNLTDKTWLYGSSEATIIETITKGRQNHMPAFGDFLGNAKVHLLAAYVYGLGGGEKPPVTAPTATPTTATAPVQP
jgi:cytochrome c oxidase cbb3-type subunit III